ncbi:MAG: cbb3-type cytochrome oxidase assembly protein CcoS [Saprospiraceae bacterium]|nr:cbb3-type cytochrome oxidase assembly protein CcoS [Saprospiraceae bacterium]MDW8483462.1 cbb3-type cytochrome oxidase assembly protein CcoS [Saprospiraceae bacterium]
MEVIFILILISLVIAAGFLLAYIWAMRTGQYDDDYTPAVRMLFDDELKEETTMSNSQKPTSKQLVHKQSK